MNTKENPVPTAPVEEPVDDSRRAAMVRLAAYTAPAMLALLLSTETSVAGPCTSRCTWPQGSSASCGSAHAARAAAQRTRDPDPDVRVGWVEGEV